MGGDSRDGFIHHLNHVDEFVFACLILDSLLIDNKVYFARLIILIGWAEYKQETRRS